ncbi:FkbM family methyltransferase [Bosea massiliensis]|uniref:FkbM family methyltransferase n=1 Tax=Bosea massiliensis TaxID=151419 RepID=A0ABW0P6H1_9HYPH
MATVVQQTAAISERVEALGQKVAAVSIRADEQSGELKQIAATMSRIQRSVTHLQQSLNRQNEAVNLAFKRIIPPDGSQWDRGMKYREGLRAVGVLNYENSDISGESRFLNRFFGEFPRALVIDVGANSGQFCELARGIGADATIHSLEPHPVSFATLKDVAGRFDVTAHQLALGDRDGEIEIFDYEDEQGSQHASLYREVIEGVHHRKAAPTMVRCLTLDNFAAAQGLNHIGLLKIDTEGHELAVLRGAKALLEAGKVDVIQFEFNEMNVIARVFMKDFFEMLPNYRIFRLLPDSVLEFATYDPTFMEVFAYQNIVCVRRDIDTNWLQSQ